jgi:hypothetical protein
MKFSSLSEHVIANVASFDGIAALAMADLAASLELPQVSCSAPDVKLRLSELAEDLKSTPTRPHAEQLLGEAALRFDIDPSQMFLDSMQRAICVTFIEGVRVFDPHYRFQQSGEVGTIHVSESLGREEIVGVCEAAFSCDAALTAATIESVLLSFFGGHDAGAFLSVVRRAADANHRPAISFAGRVLAEFRLQSLPIVRRITNYADMREALESRLRERIDVLDDVNLTRVLLEVMRRPGLLFFDHLSDRTGSLAAVIAPHRSVRSFLYEGIGDNPEILTLLSSLISETATVIDHLIALDPETRESHGELRPDSLMNAMLRSVEQQIKTLTGAILVPSEREAIQRRLRERIENDPTYGTGISQAFSIDYPVKGGEPASRLTFKIFHEFKRTQALNKKSLQCGLVVRPPELEGDLQYDYDHALSLSDELEGILDDAESLDRFSAAERLEQVGMRAIHLLGKAFSSFEGITHHGTHRISPRFENMERLRPIEQIIQLWKGCTWLDHSIPAQARENLLGTIQGWITDYNAAKGLYTSVTISDLAGAVPLFALMAHRGQDDDSCPTISYTRHLLRSYSSRIELMPSGLHAMLWILPEASRATLETLLKKELIIADIPTAGSIQFLKSHAGASAEGILRALSQALGKKSPIRLSSILSA